ncbi:MAG TPA: hypothetical protein PLJ12_16275, partial [Planctomycetota bacterium]|nr:hypothetical protein [Planctomycetota bacterium]
MSDASQPGPVPGPPLPPDFQGAADHMVYVYDSASNGPALAAVVPIRTSDQATEAGRMLVANGLDFADYPGAPLLAGPGSP